MRWERGNLTRDATFHLGNWQRCKIMEAKQLISGVGRNCPHTVLGRVAIVPTAQEIFGTQGHNTVNVKHFATATLLLKLNLKTVTGQAHGDAHKEDHRRAAFAVRRGVA